ncbi:MAG: peptide deformylase [Candidatus Niyogibacteria bacterium RIFCSPLOWO2_01_FULL_45_48]|uniref:Peptide deformylase n=2 Tax=Candidatus Niyogiibacteriota TaxID=1817912 RepID=A0A1G2F0E7_9BACT|nr:MAG: peptide deformylase [Candidatus Niyogibacteria bacterium RIFCSPLOWO2_01_FULL_45_48]OGZ31473.1 MAG: peptide deformylase [Candidatus Niyogibacteria bacterium RIFCSPLOWO2_02_FULL_45_13]
MTIVQIGNKILRRNSEDVPADKIKSKETRELITRMSDALRKEPQGIGLAAPQIGVSKSVFIVSEYVFKPSAFTQKESAEDIKKRKAEEKYAVFINPKITKLSRKKGLLSEGCLSVAGSFGKVRRSTNVTVEAFDEKGVKFKRGAGGLLAQVIQHEFDHLNGVIFVDRAEKMDKI